jgi:SMI1-KNR4 cell-wall
MLHDFKLSFDRQISTAIALKLINASEINGFSDDEISILENELSLDFPSTYKYFLSVCGNGGGKLLEQTCLEYYYTNLRNHRECVTEMMEEDIYTEYDLIHDRSFFFASHISAHYWYFICDLNPDPIIYYISISNEHPMKQCKLSEFIIGYLESSLKFFKNNKFHSYYKQ